MKWIGTKTPHHAVDGDVWIDLAGPNTAAIRERVGTGWKGIGRLDLDGPAFREFAADAVDWMEESQRACGDRMRGLWESDATAGEREQRRRNMRHLILSILGAALVVAVTLAVLSVSTARAAPATWRVVDLNEADAACYAHWRVARNYSADPDGKAAAKRRMDAVVHHYTISEWWAGNDGQPDLARSHYYGFQESVARQLHRESDAHYGRWSKARASLPNPEWSAGEAACMLRDADIMRARANLFDCIEDEHCNPPHRRNL